MQTPPNNQRPHTRCRGLSLVELLLSLAISAALLAATMVAIDTSLRAYAIAAEEASTQAATRMVTNRLLTLIRTSVAHGPLLPDLLANPPVTLNGNILTSNFIELEDPNGTIIRIEYRAATQDLWLITPPPPAIPVQQQPILGGITNAQFFLARRQNDDGVWVLDRGTMDITVQPGAESNFSLENHVNSPIRVIGSTKPRKIN